MAGSGDRGAPSASGSGPKFAGTSNPQDDGWEVKKSKNRSGPGSGKQDTPWSSSNPGPKAWAQSQGPPQSQGRGNAGPARPYGNPARVQGADRQPVGGRGKVYPQQQRRGRGEPGVRAPHPIVGAPLERGWQWAGRAEAFGSEIKREDAVPPPQDEMVGGSNDDSEPSEDDMDDDLVDDSDDDLSEEDEYEEKSTEEKKQNKWFKEFFEIIDKLTNEEINDQSRQWHCPACKDGPGAIEWFKGLQALMTHSKTKGASRVKLHRQMAALLQEELQRKGTSVIPAGEQFGKWKGLRDTTVDKEIVWPPMVIVRNTALEQDGNEKWIGMGNQELLEYFRPYPAAKARHAYGPRGHRGISVLIFENSAIGYMEAERLHKHFEDEGTDRHAWQRNPVLFLPGGKRQLYGYMATKEDMELFNQHSQGKSRLKYELRSYHEMVVIPMKKMKEDNQQLHFYKNKVTRVEEHKKATQETIVILSGKLRETMEENRLVRLNTQKQHEEHKIEMHYQEQFYKAQIEKMERRFDEKEETWNGEYQEQLAKAKSSHLTSGTNEERDLRQKQIDEYIASHNKGVEEYVAQRKQLIKLREDKMSELEERRLELENKLRQEKLEIEQDFYDACTKLMEQFKAPFFDESSSSSSSH